MSENLYNETKTILSQYGVEAHFVEGKGSVHKIYSTKGVFALKKIIPQNGVDFVRNVQTLYQRGYYHIVPIYPTMDGRYGVLDGGYLYYLMPWLSNEEKEDRFERHQKLFRELARMHTISSKDISLGEDDRKEHYENTMEEWERQKEFLEEFVERCEKEAYMSPFQLLYCSYFHDMHQALNFSIKKLEEWYEASKDNKKARTVIVHGKISTEHFLYDDRGYGYFTNFEHSKTAPPFHDLLPFLSRTLKTYPRQFEDCVEWLYTYFQHFSFKDEEMLLFMSYLAHPGPIFRVVEKYHHKGNKRKEQKMVKRLQKQYWLLKNTEYVVMRMDELERKKKEAKESPPS
ncbi:spore coat protein YsxE [Falsibacillus pallidus]|uniref:spore coat protein YsxE n=1 Tax=Falsibacillus pallidus TaxID=493781 RepID=UPI003D9957B9